MIICGPVPTRTELLAAERRRAFHREIAAKAAELKQKKFAEMLETAVAKAKSIQPEAMPAETDPPIVCPHCSNALTAPIREILPVSTRPYPLVADIQRVVARFYGVTRADICSARRMKEIVGPRQIAIFITKELTPFSLVAVGCYFGGRDHTTILHAVRKIGARVFNDAEFALEVVSLMAEFG